MNNKIISAAHKLAREGFNYAVEQIKNYHPWLNSKKEEASCTFGKIKKEADSSIEKASDGLSKYILKKYDEAKKLNKKAEKERKRAQMNSIRNTIIATTLGFGAGAATGYVLVKKSQIKESDYVFKDEDVVKNAPFKEIKNSALKENETEPENEIEINSAPKLDFGKIKMSTKFDDKYSVSEDGINLIKN